MEAGVRVWTLGEIAAEIGGQCPLGHDLIIEGPASAGSDDPNGLAFAESDRYLKQALQSGVGAIIVPPGSALGDRPHIVHPSPRVAWYLVLKLFEKPLQVSIGIHPTAVVAASSKIHPTASIGAYVVIDDHVRVEQDAVLLPFVHVGPRCSIGAGTIVHSHAVLVQDCHIEAHATIGPGAVLGFAGFGYAFDGTRHQRIPQVGSVEIGERVDIGALTAVDRAVADATRIGNGTKLDNLVQIAHNVTIGEHTVIASQVGIAGSAEVGSRVQVAGQSGFKDHVSVTDDVILGARTAVLSDIDKPGAFAGMPALPLQEFKRWCVVQKELAGLLNRVRALENQLHELAPHPEEEEDDA